jgi:hypothetical protein
MILQPDGVKRKKAETQQSVIPGREHLRERTRNPDGHWIPGLRVKNAHPGMTTWS